ncbi:MAG: hypothetical protein RSD09_05185 [Bacilli bacterium]
MEYSGILKKSIRANFVIKTLSLFLSFLIYPLSISYLTPNDFGIWIAIYSTVLMISVLDLGIYNGLRNKLVEYIADKNYVKMREVISTAYFYMFVIFTVVAIFGVAYVNFFLINDSLKDTLSIVVIYLSLRFVLSIVNSIFFAFQYSEAVALIGLIEQVFLIFGILVLKYFSIKSSLFVYSLLISSISIGIYLMLNLLVFFKFFRNLKPNFLLVKLSHLKEILGVGSKFFIIQIAGVIQFNSINLIILNYFSGLKVAEYNILYKYFSVMLFFVSVFYAPLWSLITKAYFEENWIWLRQIIRKILFLSLFCCFMGFLMLVLSDLILNIWIKDKNITFLLIDKVFIYLFFVVMVVGGVFTTFLNAINMVNDQLKASILSPLIFILFVFLFMEFSPNDMYLIVLASILSNFNAYLIAPIQTLRWFKARGMRLI